MNTQKRCFYFTFQNVFGDREYVAYEQLNLCEQAHKWCKAQGKSNIGAMIAPQYFTDGNGTDVTVAVNYDDEQFVYEFQAEYDVDGVASIEDSYIQMYECEEDGTQTDRFDDVVVPAWFVFVLDDLTAIQQEKIRTEGHD